MNAKTLILAILNFQEATGYEIRKSCTDGPFSYFVDISYGSIYPTLARLEAEGLVTSRMEQDVGKPERKIYAMTDAGHEALITALAEPPAKDKFKSEFLLIAATAEINSKEAVSRAIDMRMAHLESEIAMIRQHADDCDENATGWITEYGIGIMSFDLEHLRKNRDRLIALAGRSRPLPAAAE